MIFKKGGTMICIVRIQDIKNGASDDLVDAYYEELTEVLSQM